MTTCAEDDFAEERELWSVMLSAAECYDLDELSALVVPPED